ncbi:MAG: 1-acyl-sn-glycerol-3-phosphate acyltransferase [Firmicutes bacterium]|nr:1-acyl-sn-glycerol-3-phosphate acyltransferase [Bacillota bacterium]MBQ5436209.1 1-acyl-sn-glycerol-3-phosphate acyltransferase [Bacillota bacterium]
MIRTILFLAFGITVMILLLPVSFILWLLRDKSDEADASRFMDIVVKPGLYVLAWIAGAKIEARGTENIPDSPALFVANHQGNLDALAALMKLGKMKPVLVKKEIMSLPVARFYIDLESCVPIDRDDIRQSLTALKKITAKLKAGHSAIIFPEGTRSKGSDMNEFKHGAFKPALWADVPIVPFALDGSYKCFEEKGKLTPAVIKLSVLPPIMPEEFRGLKTQEISELVQSRIQAELDRMRSEG